MTKQELYLKTMFCCMACDGDIAPSEVELVKKVTAQTTTFANVNVEATLNAFVRAINEQGGEFLNGYLEELESMSLTEDEQMTIVDLAIQTIEADNSIEYAEIKFFKKIRFRLSLTDEKILAKYPDKEDFLLPDIQVNEVPDWYNVKFSNISMLEN